MRIKEDEYMIKEFAENFLVVEDEKFTVGVLQNVICMTIILLNDGDFFNSPIAPKKTIKTWIDTIGKPRFFIVPTYIHHIFLKQIYGRYLCTELYIVLGLRKKLPDLPNAIDLVDGLDYLWNIEIKQYHVNEIPKLDEVVFFHPINKKLILTDLAFYIISERPFFTGLFFHLNGAYDKFGPSRIFNHLILKDKSDFKISVNYILRWDFEK